MARAGSTPVGWRWALHRTPATEEWLGPRTANKREGVQL